jgi:hypothetical protein
LDPITDYRTPCRTPAVRNEADANTMLRTIERLLTNIVNLRPSNSHSSTIIQNTIVIRTKNLSIRNGPRGTGGKVDPNIAASGIRAYPKTEGSVIE